MFPKLPVELLSYIFLFSAEPDNVANPAAPFCSATVKTPLVLSSVSKHWRDVARNTPRLWTRICVTQELLVSKPAFNRRIAIDTTHIRTCLALSRKCPLDILIDARDDEWDFTEPEIMPVDPGSTFNPIVAPALINSALSLLIPHLRRWHSLTIFTDTWAPMFIALNMINPSITTLGAPLLEFLTLMRCNDFVSFSPEFRPRQLAKPAFLRRKKKACVGAGSQCSQQPKTTTNVLPRLKHLTLKGVHLDWPALADAMETSQVGGLKSLSLASHSLQVRPSRCDFRRLLSASPGLEVLSVSGSGPIPEEPSSPEGGNTSGKDKVSLGKLRKLAVGYRSLREARAVFDSIWTPSVKEMVLEDVAHPGEVNDVDGNRVLACLCKGKGEVEEGSLQVEELTLRNVKLGKQSIDRDTLRTVLDGATRLRKLKAEDVGVETMLAALIPEDEQDGRYPCPELETLSVKTGAACCSSSSSPLNDVPSWFEMTKRLAEGRARKTSPLRQIKICMELPHGSQPAVAERVETVVAGTTFVAIEVKEKARMCDADEDEEADDEAEAYLPGGTFNDPVFDAYWGSSSPAFRGAGEQISAKFGVAV
ncbi:hypothetical protein F5887DRAFT_1163467 [Amanita rubescens]|nr:hypothetical protein F5887DRAFT_1163467 [Amanita rubescens]